MSKRKEETPDEIFSSVSLINSPPSILMKLEGAVVRFPSRAEKVTLEETENFCIREDRELQEVERSIDLARSVAYLKPAKCPLLG